MGEREYQIIHTRLRNKCNSQNYDLFQTNLVPSRLCKCGEIETSQHYLLECKHHNIIKNNLFENTENLTTITLDVLLYGEESLTFHKNVRIFLEGQSFIRNSKRFKP